MSAETVSRQTLVIDHKTGLQVFRKSREWTQEQAAEYFGVTVRGYQHWEAGTRAIPGPVDRLMEVQGNLDQLTIVYNGREEHDAG